MRAGLGGRVACVGAAHLAAAGLPASVALLKIGFGSGAELSAEVRSLGAAWHESMHDVVRAWRHAVTPIILHAVVTVVIQLFRQVEAPTLATDTEVSLDKINEQIQWLR